MKEMLNYRYETLELGSFEVHVRSLRDVQEYQDDDDLALQAGVNDTQWSISGVLWPSSYVLATIMEARNINNIKILEVGCGLALSSLILKIRGADITATDNNPAVKSFLVENTRINRCEEIPFKQADWKSGVINIGESYDLIIGSDVLYEQHHPANLCNFINQNAKNNCEVIIVDPSRGHINKFTKIMKENGFAHTASNEIYLERYSIKFKGTVNYYKR